jgi:hypothetical protein
MHKVLLTSVSALALAYGSAAFAAGSSSTYLNQAGTGQSANIDQTGATGGKVGTNDHPFTQQDGTGAGGNTIAITQTGSNNSTQGFSSWVSYGYGAVQGNPNGYPGQSGTGNQATITQNGSDGLVQIGQKGTQNGDNVGGGSISQGVLSLRDKVFVLQNGSLNLFTISQDNTNSAVGTSNSSNNSVNLQQSGTANDATISQLGTYTPGINPYGVGLGVTAYQYAGWNHLSSVQTGTQNSLQTTQSNTAPGAGAKNSITNMQSGSGQVAWVGLTGVGQNGSLLRIENDQSGTSNKLDVSAQTGTSNIITSTQSGNLNTLTVISQSSSGNFIINNQLGTTSTATVTSQDGTGGHINNRQTGSNGTATYAQSGSNNVERLFDQKGSWNSVNVTQDSAASNNIAAMLQNGNGGSAAEKNSILLTQGGGANNFAFLVQGGSFSGTGLGTMLTAGAAVNSNNIVGAQSGSSNYAAVSQQSNANTASFNQGGSGNSTVIKQ